MRFEEEFPTLAKILEEQNKGGLPSTILRSSVKFSCLDKQRVREAIDKCSYEIDDKHGEYGVSLTVDPYKLKEELGL